MNSSNIGGYKQITNASGGQISGGQPVNLLGVFCSSSTAGTLAVFDDIATGTGTKAVDTFTLVAGTFHPIPIGLSVGMNIVCGGTFSATLVFAA